MYSFIKHILQKILCIETVYGFIKAEKTSVHTSLLIFNNGWTVTSWNRGLTNGLTLQVQVLAPWFTKSTRLYYKWHGIAEIEICSTKNVIVCFWCVSDCIQIYSANSETIWNYHSSPYIHYLSTVNSHHYAIKFHNLIGISFRFDDI